MIALLGGCASVPYSVTDTVMLYPNNAVAQRWGQLTFFNQYQTNRTKNKHQIILKVPKQKPLSGEMLFIENSGETEMEESFWDNMSFGFGTGFGSGHHGGYWGINMSPRGRYRSDKAKVVINAYNDRISMNCKGDFNRRQNIGSLSCQLTNGMSYQGTIKRVLVK